MAEEALGYTCPNCGAPLRFDAGSGKLTCDWCGSTFTIEEIKALYEKKKEKEEEAAGHDQSGQPQDGEWAAGKMRAYSCTSCGAQLLCDADTAATACPYCGNPVVIVSQFSGVKAPDWVVPFCFNKEQAAEKLKSYYKGKHLLPKAFADENHMEEMQGVYVPFWLFSGSVDAALSMEGRNSQISREGDFEVTRTRIYDVERAGTVDFSRIPVDASTKMADDLMDSIEPFDYTRLEPFAYEYLPGFLASRYDVDQKDCIGRADERAANSAVSAMRSTVSGYGSVTVKNQKTRVHHGDTQYALMPVWLLHTKWKGQDFMFAMNGQTQKMTGNLPVDRVKSALYFTGITLLSALVIWLMLFLANGETDSADIVIAIAAGCLIGGLGIAAMIRQMKPVETRKEAQFYIKQGGVHLKVQKDLYLRTVETRTRVQQGPPPGAAGPGRK